jgi:hypothetical protein
MNAAGDSTQFIVDAQGNRTGVILDLDSYQALLEAREELEELRAYDEAEAEGGESLPFEQAVNEIEGRRE